VEPITEYGDHGTRAVLMRELALSGSLLMQLALGLGDIDQSSRYDWSGEVRCLNGWSAS